MLTHATVLDPPGQRCGMQALRGRGPPLGPWHWRGGILLLPGLGRVPYKPSWCGSQVPPACVGGHTQVFLLAVAGVCGCCGALRPRYKRLVDNIFPEDPEVGHTSARHQLPPSHPVQGCGGKAGLLHSSPAGRSDSGQCGEAAGGLRGPPRCGDLDRLKSGYAEGLGSRFWHTLGLRCTIETSFSLVSLCARVP